MVDEAGATELKLARVTRHQCILAHIQVSLYFIALDAVLVLAGERAYVLFKWTALDMLTSRLGVHGVLFARHRALLMSTLKLHLTDDLPHEFLRRLHSFVVAILTAGIFSALFAQGPLAVLAYHG